MMLDRLLNKSSGSAVDIDALAVSLRTLEESMPGAVSRNPRAGVRKTIAFLEKHSGKTVQDVAAALAEQKAKAPAKKKAAPLRAETVSHHVHALQKAESSPAEFSGALAALKADKKVRMAELKAIVKEYTGSAASLKTKASGYSVIDHAFDQRWKLRNR